MIRVGKAAPDFQLQASRPLNQVPTWCVRCVVCGIPTNPFLQPKNNGTLKERRRP